MVTRRTIVLTEDAWIILQEALGNSDAENESQVILGGFELIQKLIAAQDRLQKRLAAAERVVEWARMVDKGNHYRNEITVALEAYYKVVSLNTPSPRI